jgi:hypothetical protein
MNDMPFPLGPASLPSYTYITKVSFLLVFSSIAFLILFTAV